MKIAVGDQVRVHHHPPGLKQSFAEGVVRQVDVTTLRGRGFIVVTTREVILGREQAIGSGGQHFALYEHHGDFPDRIEVLSPAEQPVEPLSGNEIPSQPHTEPESAIEVDRAPQPEPDHGDRQGSRSLGNVISAVFGRRS